MQLTIKFRSFLTFSALIILLGAVFLFHTSSTAFAETLITVTTANDELDVNGTCSFREAIQTANTGLPVDGCVLDGSGEVVILLSSDTYNILIAGGSEDANQTGDFDISTSMTIRGVSAASTQINGNVLDRVFDVDPLESGDIEVVLEDLTVENGRPPTFEDGGGIRQHDDVLSLNRVVVANNQIPVVPPTDFGGSGGGISNELGTLNLTKTNIINNVNNKGIGGGLFIGDNLNSGAVMNMVDSIVANNQALNPNGTVSGGGIMSMRSQLNIMNSAIMGNFVEGQAGGIGVGFFEGGANITNSTISGNMSIGSGGGIRNFGLLNLSFSTVTNNTASATDITEVGDGGGLQNNIIATAVLKGNIFYGNIDNTTPGANNIYPDISNTGTMTATDNLLGDPAGTTTIFNGVDNNIVGVDPNLLIPTDATDYFIPAVGSTALNRISIQDCTLLSLGENPLFEDGEFNVADQIGTARPDPIIERCDMGAIERVYPFIYLPLILNGEE